MGDRVARFILRRGRKDGPLLDLYQSDRMSPAPLQRNIQHLNVTGTFCSVGSGNLLCRWEGRNKERKCGNPQGARGLSQQA